MRVRSWEMSWQDPVDGFFERAIPAKYHPATYKAPDDCFYGSVMVEQSQKQIPAGAAALEHLTGPSRGTVTWLADSALDISLKANRFLTVSPARPGEKRNAMIARLHRAEDTYEIEAIEGRQVWVNGEQVTARKLKSGDMIEFDETGPLSRFCLYRGDRRARKMATEILRDGLVYLRVSRQPLATRVLRAFSGLFRPLLRETTYLFRVGVVLAIAALGALAYQQNQLNVLLQQRIEEDSTLLGSFSGALARARSEALTPGDLKTLRRELASQMSSNVERLVALEQRSSANARVIAASMPSVVFIQGAYGFKETSSGRMLRFGVDEKGRPIIAPNGQPLLTLEGNGKIAERQYTGTGFAVGVAGALVTNRHVARPWENYAKAKALAGQGLEPVIIKLIIFVPGKPVPYGVELVRASDGADLAILRLNNTAEPIPGLSLAGAAPAPGDEIIVMGYPTGLRAMLAQSGENFIKDLENTKDTGFWSVAARLAKKGYIAPLSSRGIVSQVAAATIVYDAETTYGGSGGPVLDTNGAVIAVNTAILPGYGGSNLGIPVSRVKALLEKTDLR